MRCFIAVNLSASLKREVAAAVKGLAAGNWDVKWVAADNLHITLRFLGTVADDTVERIMELLKTVASGHGSFAVPLRGVGVFPDRRKPRVVWIDIPDSGELTRLQAEVEEACVTIGFTKEDRPFSPHLTLGRIRSMDPKDREPFMRAVETLKDRDFGNIGVNKISLMKSELEPAGARYFIVAEYPLK